MGILEKLRPQPRWKHADPAVRAAAVYELGPEDSEALRALAREDADARVRRAAVNRIDELPLLADVARTDPDEEVRADAVRGLAGLAAEADEASQAVEAVRHLISLGRTREIVVAARENRDPAIRAAIIDLIDDGKALGSISRHAADAQTRLRALARVSDPAEILNVALKSEHTDTAVAAHVRLAGNDFFCGLTFPVGQSHCSLILGGWGGTTVGLSNLDGRDASENETTREMRFEDKRWYRVRVAVSVTHIRAWLDNESIVEVARAGRRIGIRPEVEPSLPMGIAGFRTGAGIRAIQIRAL